MLPSYARCPGYKDKPCLNVWKVNSLSLDVFASEASKHPDYGRRWPCSSWQKWKKNGSGKEWVFFFRSKRTKTHQMCSFMWADKFWVMSYSKSHLEQMLKDLIRETEKWDLTPKPAGLWWTSTYGSEEKQELMIDTETGVPQNTI